MGFARRTVLFIVALGGLGVLVLSLFVVYLVRTLPSVEQIATREVKQSTKIYDRDQKVLLYEISNGEKRTVLPLAEIPQSVKDATIAIEDDRFYEEPAFDWKAIVRAFLVDLRNRRIVQGGSTITQQLAKNAFLSSDQTLTRKLREFLLAIALNRRYSKDKILEFYLNEIPYGSTAYGIEAASETYFGKPAKDLTLPEAALLAALPKAPTYYSPWGSHVRELMARKNFILEKMFQLGKISEGDLDAALHTTLVFAPQGQGLKAPHFVMAVEDYLVQKYGEDMVREGGLRVVTTLNWDLQQAAEKAVASGTERNAALYNGTNAALVAQDVATGQVLAMVGSRDYFDIQHEGNFNVAAQGLRQPGSALKPFVYLTAFEKGYTPDTVVFDVPTEFTAQNSLCPPAPDFNDDKKVCFHPQNFDDQFRGPVPLRQALAQSINVPSVKVLYLAGLPDVIANARRFGLTTLTDPNLYGLSLVLGGGAVRLVDLVEAYSVLAAEGVKHAQTMVLEVRDSYGRVLESFSDKAESVVEPEYPRLINAILSDPGLRAGLFQTSLPLTIFPNHDVALKTGTSNDYRDAWAMGYTPSLVAGVWAGNNDNSPMQRHGSSILAAVPIWHDFMEEALKSQPEETFTRPEPLTSSKPILAGDYLAGNQIHSILYYVDRRDPGGPPLQDPGSDPQFTNWETGVLGWAAKTLPNFKDLNQSTSSVVQGLPLGPLPTIDIKEPRVGGFVTTPLGVVATITSGNPIHTVRVYFNGRLVQELGGGFGTSYELRSSFSPPIPQSQNLLEVEAVDSNNFTARAAVIVYK